MDDLSAFLGLSTSDAPAPPPPPPALSAEVVPTAPGRWRGRPGAYLLTPRQMKERERNFTAVVLYDDETKKYLRGQLSERERKLVAFVVKTGNVALGAEEVGVALRAAHRYLARSGVRRYVELLRRRAAQAADLTPDKVSAVVSRAVDGDPTLKPEQVAAAQAAAKLMAPSAKPGVSVTVNQQNNYAGASPFAGLDSAAMLDEVKKNLLEMGHGE